MSSDLQFKYMVKKLDDKVEIIVSHNDIYGCKISNDELLAKSNNMLSIDKFESAFNFGIDNTAGWSIQWIVEYNTMNITMSYNSFFGSFTLDFVLDRYVKCVDTENEEKKGEIMSGSKITKCIINDVDIKIYKYAIVLRHLVSCLNIELVLSDSNFDCVNDVYRHKLTGLKFKKGKYNMEGYKYCEVVDISIPGYNALMSVDTISKIVKFLGFTMELEIKLASGDHIYRRI